jgi:hypothetical protein
MTLKRILVGVFAASIALTLMVGILYQVLYPHEVCTNKTTTILGVKNCNDVEEKS